VAQRIVALVLFTFCVAYLYGAWKLSFGSVTAPKAGFVPILAGLGGVALGAINLARSLYAGTHVENGEPTDLKRAGAFTLGLAGYTVLLGVAGFMAATLLTALYLLKLGGMRGWLKPVLISGLLAIGLDVLFEQLLKLPLP